jgi:fumarate reductase subunit D
MISDNRVHSLLQDVRIRPRIGNCICYGVSLVAAVSNHSLTASVVAFLYHTPSIWRVYMLWILG